MSVPKLNARTTLWLAGAGVCMGYYWLRTQPFPRPTAVGVERRLFGLGEDTPALQERPGGSQVTATFSWQAPSPSPAPPSLPAAWPGWLYDHVRLRLSAGPRGVRPALAPLPLDGTWVLEGDRLRYRWRLSGGWLDAQHLGGENYDERSGPRGFWLLDLTSGRTYRGEAATARRARIGETEEEPYYPAGTADGPDPVAPALDDLDPDAPNSSSVRLLEEGDAALRWAEDSDYAADLIAATTTEPYRSLVLSPRSALLSVSGDGRTLFLRKADGLWRLDLRKPVSALLDEVTLPELPLDGVLPR